MTDPSHPAPGPGTAGLEARLQRGLQARADAVEPSAGAWGAVASRIDPARRRRRRRLALGLPAAALALVALVVGVVAFVNRDPGAGPRLRTNPALPGEGPSLAPTTVPAMSEPYVVAEGDGWHVLAGEVHDHGVCVQFHPREVRDLGPASSTCEASMSERGRWWDVGGWPPPSAPGGVVVQQSYAYGLVPSEASKVVWRFTDGAEATLEARPIPGREVDAFAGLVPADLMSADRVTVYDGDGRILLDEEIRSSD